jgi:hypothetical protein
MAHSFNAKYTGLTGRIRANPGQKYKTLSEKQTKSQKGWDMAQVVEHKHKTLSWNTNTAPK